MDDKDIDRKVNRALLNWLWMAACGFAGAWLVSVLFFR